MRSSANSHTFRRTLWYAALGAADLAFGVHPGASSPEGRKTYSVHATFDVRYYPGQGRQTLDIFAPEGEGNFPVVLFVHGGAWTFGDKNLFGLYRSVGRFLARNGVVAVMVNYSLSPKVRHPEHIRDIARAFAWTRHHVLAYGGDPDRIVLCGHSAGGHLVSLLATSDSYLREEELGLQAKDRAAIRGVISVCGVYRVPDPDEFLEMMDETLQVLAVPDGLEHLLLRHGPTLNPFRIVFGDDPEVRSEASPLMHVRPGLPPFLIISASEEVPGLADMACEFTTALAGCGNEVEIRTLKDTNHNTILFRAGQPSNSAGPLLLQFIDQHAGASDKRF